MFKGFVAPRQGQFGPPRQRRQRLGEYRPGAESIVPVPIAREKGKVEGVGLIVVVKPGFILPVLETQGKSQGAIRHVNGIPGQQQVEHDLLELGVRNIRPLRPAQQFGRVAIFARRLGHAQAGVGGPGRIICGIPAFTGDRVIHAGLKAVVVVTRTRAEVAGAGRTGPRVALRPAQAREGEIHARGKRVNRPVKVKLVAGPDQAGIQGPVLPGQVEVRLQAEQCPQVLAPGCGDGADRPVFLRRVDGAAQDALQRLVRDRFEPAPSRIQLQPEVVFGHDNVANVRIEGVAAGGLLLGVAE